MEVVVVVADGAVAGADGAGGFAAAAAAVAVVDVDVVAAGDVGAEFVVGDAVAVVAE